MTLTEAAEIIHLRPRVKVRDERFVLRASSDGYVIYDRGEAICTFHGPQLGLASKTLRALQDDDGGAA